MHEMDPPPAYSNTDMPPTYQAPQTAKDIEAAEQVQRGDIPPVRITGYR